MKLLIAALASLALAMPVAAQDRGPGDAGSRVSTGQVVPEGTCTRGEAVNGERCVCRRLAESASRLAARTVCRTVSGWRQWERETR